MLNQIENAEEQYKLLRGLAVLLIQNLYTKSYRIVWRTHISKIQDLYFI